MPRTTPIWYRVTRTVGPLYEVRQLEETAILFTTMAVDDHQAGGQPQQDERAPDTSFPVLLEPHGWRFDAPSGQSLMAAARTAGIALPASCRNGTCRTCLCRMVSGRVRYSIEWPGVSAEEKRDGFILPCVAQAESAVVIDVPAARLLQPG